VASSDASFRRYFRLYKENQSYILMDSTKDKESLKPFVDINQKLLDANVKVPKIVYQDLIAGYLILEDFGSTHLQDIIDDSNYQLLYKKAIDEIIKMQKASTHNLPLYDEDFLLFEMSLMQEWYLRKHLDISLSQDELDMIQTTQNFIAKQVISQPNGVFVHRDFHSRNIMIVSDCIGVIDFQDARSGAITYDLVSLLKDCYVSFDSLEIEKLALYFKERSQLKVSNEEFIEWFDMMGLQRHIKILGIFARLSIRDGKDNYLNDIPQTLQYIVKTASKYPQTKNIGIFLERFTKDDL
jgi:aminoglycoside/choline kinase family phosphotransferase